jgi:hypothetical protein
MKVSAPGNWIRMTRLAPCGQPSQKGRHVSSPVIRDTGENAQKVRIGFQPDLIVQSLGAAARHRASERSTRIMSSEMQGSTSILLHVFERRWPVYRTPKWDRS